MHITCKTKGVQEVIANLKKYDDDTQQKVGEVVNNSLKNIARGARSRVPQKSGLLKSSIRKSYSKKKMGGIVSSGGKKAPHAHLVEFGTKAHSLTKGTTNNAGRAAKKGKRLVLVIKGNPVSGEIIHPGSKPRPFMQPAYYQERSNYIEGLKKAVKPD